MNSKANHNINKFAEKASVSPHINLTELQIERHNAYCLNIVKMIFLFWEELGHVFIWTSNYHQLSDVMSLSTLLPPFILSPPSRCPVVRKWTDSHKTADCGGWCSWWDPATHYWATGGYHAAHSSQGDLPVGKWSGSDLSKPSQKPNSTQNSHKIKIKATILIVKRANSVLLHWLHQIYLVHKHSQMH